MTVGQRARWTLALLGTAAGVLLFRGFPDRDIALLGIQYHRYFAFHSALVPLALYWLLVRIRRPLWLLSLFAGVVAGAGLAFGVHLLVDVFQPKSVVFPLVGTPVRDTLLDDRLWFLVNALASATVSVLALSRRSKAEA